ncbi:hypothetical protein F5Y18DRAFT_424427 [Xylariaceae sp. FL1019]|nr:hypothetical protein F5Y18DRAFT_424427 [Xylariaceae sp. FL1019]
MANTNPKIGIKQNRETSSEQSEHTITDIATWPELAKYLTAYCPEVEGPKDRKISIEVRVIPGHRPGFKRSTTIEDILCRVPNAKVHRLATADERQSSQEETGFVDITHKWVEYTPKSVRDNGGVTMTCLRCRQRGTEIIAEKLGCDWDESLALMSAEWVNSW